MKTVPYTPEYREDIRRICIETASPDNKVNPEHHYFTLMMYCDPYIDHETAFILMDDENRPQGYILCAENYREFEKHIDPYLQKIRKECPNYASRADISLYEKYQDEYPAHLHIDIMEEYTGGGNGTKLMKTLIDHLKTEHVKGLILGADKNNTRAVSFYKKMGFEAIEENEGGVVLAMKL